MAELLWRSGTRGWRARSTTMVFNIRKVWRLPNHGEQFQLNVYGWCPASRLHTSDHMQVTQAMLDADKFMRQMGDTPLIGYTPEILRWELKRPDYDHGRTMWEAEGTRWRYQVVDRGGAWKVSRFLMRKHELGPGWAPMSGGVQRFGSLAEAQEEADRQEKAVMQHDSVRLGDNMFTTSLTKQQRGEAQMFDPTKPYMVLDPRIVDRNNWLDTKEDAELVARDQMRQLSGPAGCVATSTELLVVKVVARVRLAVPPIEVTEVD